MVKQGHSLPRRELVVLQRRGHVELAPRGAVEGEMQRGQGQDGAHDVVTLEAHGGNSVAPEVLAEAVVGEGGVGGGGVVEQQLEVKRVEVARAISCRGAGQARGPGLEKVAADVVFEAVAARWPLLVALGGC